MIKQILNDLDNELEEMKERRRKNERAQEKK